jgi:hypothetical protein
MAAGVPVIVLREFQETFGGAALYAEPEAAWKTIHDLWRDDRPIWLAQRPAANSCLNIAQYDQ